MSNVTNNPAIQRMNELLDEHSFVELGALVTSRNTDFDLNQQQTPSDVVVIGHGLITTPSSGIRIQSGCFCIKRKHW